MNKILLFTLAMAFCFGSFHTYAQDLTADPNEGEKGSIFPITITGEGSDWQVTPYSYFYVNISGMLMSLENEFMTDEGAITADGIIMNNAEAGPRDIDVAYYNGYEWNTTFGPEAFNVLESSLESVEPSMLPRGTTTTVTITGNNTNWSDEDTFLDSYCTDEENITISNVTLEDSNTLTVDITVDGQADLGTQDIFVYYLLNGNAGGERTDALESAIEIVQGIGTEDLPTAIAEFHLAPNPFVNQLEINYQLDKEAEVSIELFDLSGKSVARILEANQLPGTYNASFSADAQDFEAGMYILKMTVNGQVHSRSVLKIK